MPCSSMDLTSRWLVRGHSPFHIPWFQIKFSLLSWQFRCISCQSESTGVLGVVVWGQKVRQSGRLWANDLPMQLFGRRNFVHIVEAFSRVRIEYRWMSAVFSGVLEDEWRLMDRSQSIHWAFLTALKDLVIANKVKVEEFGCYSSSLELLLLVQFIHLRYLFWIPSRFLMFSTFVEQHLLHISKQV